MLFDRHTVVLLVRPADAPTLPEGARDALQDGHLARQAELHEQGLLVVAGPLVEQDDESLRGIAVLATDAETARRLYDSDPLVQADQLSALLMTWMVPAGGVRFEDVAFPHSAAEAMSDDGRA